MFTHSLEPAMIGRDKQTDNLGCNEIKSSGEKVNAKYVQNKCYSTTRL